MQDRIVDIERLMLEATSFEFKIFDPKRIMFKILTDDFKMHFCTGNADHDAIYKLALNISKDLNYTFSLIKHFHGTNAVACVELAFRLLDRGMNFDAAFRPGKPVDPTIEAALAREEQRTGLELPALHDPQNPYRRYFTSRVEVLETIMDLLDLYTVHRTVTFAGPAFTNEQIMQVKIGFNRIAQRYEVPRHSNDQPEESEAEQARDYVAKLKLERDFTIEEPITAQNSPTDEPNGLNGNAGTANGETPQGHVITERKALIAVRRFILQSSDAQEERKILDEYYLVKDEEYDLVHEEEDGWESVSESDEDDDRGGRRSKR
jgi:CTD kinase subunit beta